MTASFFNFNARLRGFLAANAKASSGANQVHHETEFNALALELFALQYASNPAYTKICDHQRVTPLTVKHWAQIPAVLTAAFKEWDLTCLTPEQRSRVFHSSGTTAQRPSRHFHNDVSLAIYETSLKAGFPIPLAERGRLLILAPTPAEVPHSSLVHMFDALRRESAAPESAFVGRVGPDGAWMLDFDAALASLRSHAPAPDGEPLLVLGTAFSFVHLLDFLADQNLYFKLPTGSRVLETGGYKGRSRTLSKTELHALVTKHLGVPASQILCEYGMSELSSQAYDVVTTHKDRSFYFPPWSRVQIISPESGRVVADGETGLIRIFDLANICSVMAIQTEDLGIRRGDGFELIGRTALAEPRGCSLMAV